MASHSCMVSSRWCALCEKARSPAGSLLIADVWCRLQHLPKWFHYNREFACPRGVEDILVDIKSHYSYQHDKTHGSFRLRVKEGSFTYSEIIVMLRENGTGRPPSYVYLLAKTPETRTTSSLSSLSSTTLSWRLTLPTMLSSLNSRPPGTTAIERLKFPCCFFDVRFMYEERLILFFLLFADHNCCSRE